MCPRRSFYPGADLNSNACATLKEAGACGVSDNAATFAEKLDALLVLVVNAAQLNRCCLVKQALHNI